MIRVLALFASRVHDLSLWAARATEMLLFVIGFSMAMLIGVQVFSRYLLNHSIFWSEEIGRVCLVWITFLGASVAYKRHAHIGVDFVVMRLSGGVRRVLAILVVLASLAFFGVLIIHGTAFTRFVAGQRTAALGLPLALPYAVIPLSGGLFLLHGVSHLFTILQWNADEQ